MSTPPRFKEHKGSPGRDYTGAVQTPHELIIRPIGVIRSEHKERYGTPRQAAVDNEVGQRMSTDAQLELFLDQVPVQALQDLDGFSHIWLIGNFHLNKGWNATVMPPRGPRIKRGLLSTRAPHRPNGLSLSCVELHKIEKNILFLGRVDILDGTPIFDIKPYLPFADSFPEAKAGWVDQLENKEGSPPSKTTLSPTKD